jgi:hypothetical protein
MSAPAPSTPPDFYAWLRANGWTEDISLSTESWIGGAWWHDGAGRAEREDWLADEFEDYLAGLLEDQPAIVSK